MKKLLLILLSFLPILLFGQSSFLYDIDSNLVHFQQDTIKMPVPNSGAQGTTDWINPTDGLAEFWFLQGFSDATTSIITGNGFIGNSQRIDLPALNQLGRLDSDPISVTVGSIYKLKLKYRASADASVWLYFAVSEIGGSGEKLQVQPNTNIGDAIVYESTSFILNTPTVFFYVSSGSNTGAEWVEIDEIKLIKIRDYEPELIYY